MSRKIKFRAWDLDSKEYTTSEFLISGCYKHEIEVMGVSTSSEEELLNENVILEQWTGLKDLNKTDIYEGDVVIVNTKPILDLEAINGTFKVVYSDIMAGFTLDGIEPKYPCYGLYDTDKDFKIIGNIHQNPELLL